MTLSIPSTETNYSAELAKGIGTTETEIFIAGPLPKVTANGILAIDRGTKNFEVITYESINTSNNSITGCVRGLPDSGASLVGEEVFAKPHSAKADISCVSTHYIYEILKTSVELSLETIRNGQGQYQALGNRTIQTIQSEMESELERYLIQINNSQSGQVLTIQQFVTNMEEKFATFVAESLQLETIATWENASDGDLSVAYQGKGARKGTFESGDYIFIVTTHEFVQGSQDGVVLILEEDGATTARTVTKSQTNPDNITVL